MILVQWFIYVEHAIGATFPPFFMQVDYLVVRCLFVFLFQLLHAVAINFDLVALERDLALVHSQWTLGLSYFFMFEAGAAKWRRRRQLRYD